MSAVELTIAHPYDPSSPGASGFDSFLKGLLKKAPAEWELEVLGLSTDPHQRPVGERSILDVGGRRISFLPVMSDRRPERVRRVPLSLRYAIACRRSTSVAPRGRIVQYQRFESILAVPPRPGSSSTCFLHNHPPELAGPSSGVRWRGFGRVMEALLGRTLARVDAVWAVDPRTPQWLADAYPSAAPARLLPVWADPDVFHPADSERDGDRLWLRSQLGLPREVELCLFAGRLEAQKDLPMLVRCWERVARQRPEAYLAIVGEGRAAHDARRLADQLGVADRIRWSAFRPWQELARCYRGADCIVCSSAYESGPRLVVESLACGTPPVTFAVGQAPEMLAPIEELGLIAEQRTEEALAAGVERALNLPRDPELVARLTRCAAPFTPGRALAPVLDLYREWLSAEARG